MGYVNGQDIEFVCPQCKAGLKLEIQWHPFREGEGFNPSWFEAKCLKCGSEMEKKEGEVWW